MSARKIRVQKAFQFWHTPKVTKTHSREALENAKKNKAKAEEAQE